RALRADRIAPRRIELRGIDHRGQPPRVQRAGAVAAFATYARLCEWRVNVAVLGAEGRLRLRSMAIKTIRFNRTVQPHLAVGLITRRNIPTTRLCVPGDGRLKEEAVNHRQEAAPR